MGAASADVSATSDQIGTVYETALLQCGVCPDSEKAMHLARKSSAQTIVYENSFLPGSDGNPPLPAFHI